MARSLSFVFNGTTFDAVLNKVDRTKLYGSVRVLTKDADARPCTVATLGSDGKTLIPRGGTALGYVNTEGQWINRDELQPVNLAGETVQEVPSSFDAAIELNTEVNSEALLNNNVRLTYRLTSEDRLPEEFHTALANGKIFSFDFSYRGGVGHDPAFILADAEANVWMLITDANDVQFVSLEQATLCAGDVIEDELDGDDNTIDFGML